MTDREIIQALECCRNDFSMSNCLDCPYNKAKSAKCITFMIEDTLALITRQQAEIEEMHKRVMRLDSEREEWSRTVTTEKLKNIELQAEIERLEIRLRKVRNQFTDLGKMYSEIRAEAIKEFAQQMKERFLKLEYRAKTPRKTIRIEELQEQMDWVLHSVSIETIDNLVKEMVGDAE